MVNSLITPILTFYSLPDHLIVSNPQPTRETLVTLSLSKQAPTYSNTPFHSTLCA